MADQKRWFKVWTSLLVDMDARSAADVGHWVRLGCRIALVGRAGTVIFDGWDHVARFFGVTMEGAPMLLNSLPSLHIAEQKRRDANPGVTVAVTMLNWRKYQEDSSAERMRRMRLGVTAKTRRDEKRREEKKYPPIIPPHAEVHEHAKQLLEFLNRKAGRHYQPTKSNLALIAARLRDGATVDQCRAVIARKVAAWLADAAMAGYLRPATLFNATKFAQYQGELPATAFSRPEGTP